MVHSISNHGAQNKTPGTMLNASRANLEQNTKQHRRYRRVPRIFIDYLVTTVTGINIS
jgi:hypothetical protein